MSELAQQLREDAEFMIVVRPVDLPREQRITWIAAAELDRLTAEVAGLKADAEANRDMLTDARGELAVLRDALGVSYEPHQSLQERTLEAATALLADAERWKCLCELAGYWQDGSSQTVQLFDDDATRQYFIQAGKKMYSGGSYATAIDAARAALAAQEPIAQEQK